MIIALDLGDRRIGVARSDPTRTLASPVGVAPRAGLDETAAAVRARCGEGPIEVVVIGLPRNMDGTYGPQAEKVRQIGAELGAALGAPVVFWDERLTSVAADELLAARGLSWRERKAQNDALAAAILLQEYLDHGTR